MKSILILITLIFYSGSFAQMSIVTLDQNNVSTISTDGGLFFNNYAQGMAAYEVPAGSGSSSLYAGSFWFGGIDVNGQLKLAAQTFMPSSDIFPGPISYDFSGNSYFDSVAYQNLYLSSIWAVSKAEIDNHIANYDDVAYVMPSSIANWPGNGDTSLLVAENLAPFVDMNNDNVYSPELGDYPNIRGDRAVYSIMNDFMDVHGSGGSPIALEFHMMMYQFSTNDYLNNATFANIRVFNRGSQTLYDYYTSFWLDPDVGNYADDYVGCDSTRSLMFAYNADDLDEAGGGVPGYGAIPPAIGVKCLNDNASSIVSSPEPMATMDYYSLMDGNMANGTPFLNNLGQETNFQYHGNPNEIMDWTEVSAANPPGDRRMMMSVNRPVFQPFTSYCLDYAIIYSRDGNSNLENAEGLLSMADDVQAFYDAEQFDCNQVTVGIDELEELEFSMHPNPTNGNITIKIGESNPELGIAITDVTGRLVYNNTFNNHSGEIEIELNERSGMYLVRLTTTISQTTQRLIIR